MGFVPCHVPLSVQWPLTPSMLTPAAASSCHDQYGLHPSGVWELLALWGDRTTSVLLTSVSRQLIQGGPEAGEQPRAVNGRSRGAASLPVAPGCHFFGLLRKVSEETLACLFAFLFGNSLSLYSRTGNQGFGPREPPKGRRWAVSMHLSSILSSCSPGHGPQSASPGSGPGSSSCCREDSSSAWGCWSVGG